MRKLILILTALTLLGGCATVVVEAPPGKEVKLAKENSGLQSAGSKKVWYLLWGLVPITDNSTADLVSQCNEEVRVKRQEDVLDYLVGSLTLGILTSVTVEVQCR